MSINDLAQQDFERAVSRGFWRKILSRLTGENNQLLPFDEVRERLPMRGQHYSGLKQVEIDKIIGSLGRYHDFDRAFLPLQRRTKDRWINVDKAHYEQIVLPPVELIKIGDIYFVKDGNHRVSVARGQGQAFVDAYVTEIDIPVKLTADMRMDDLDSKQALAEFILQTRLTDSYPEAEIELSVPDYYKELLRHIEVHQWYMGEQRGAEVPYQEAVVSWYDHVYLPLAETIREQSLLKDFPGASEADLCLWLMEYQGYLRRAYRERSEEGIDEEAEAARQLVVDYPLPAVKRLVGVINRTNWLDEMILHQEKAEFLKKTQLLEIRPEAKIEMTLLGQYERIAEHISTHHWYLGEQRKAEVPYEEAVASWYDHIYYPLVEIIREQEILNEFPHRTEADLYLWIITHQWYLRETYGEDVPLEEAAGQFAEDYSERPVKKVVKALKKVTGNE